MIAAPPRFISRSQDHAYTFDGVTYPGTTGILKVLDKSGPLMGWAARNTAEAAIDLGPEALANLVATVGRAGTVKALTARSAWKNEEARDLGTRVHALAELVATNRPLPPDIQPIDLVRVQHYQSWWANSGWSIRAIEALLVDPVHGYGGTLDLLCRDADGRTVLADIKTGKGVYRETALQLAAYGSATWLDQGDGRLYAMPPIDRYAVIHLTGEGAREVEMVVGPSEIAAFRACITLAAWHTQQKGRSL